MDVKEFLGISLFIWLEETTEISTIDIIDKKIIQQFYSNKN